jgi:phosphoribosyl 1,2-cyclic phosphodiesterase|nr:MAG TPA: YycJ-like MBL-fold protein [Caudoviricetes sp.]
MKLKCIATGSKGNCYLLTSESGETLILDCGIPVKAIKEALNWNIKGIQGAVCTHHHRDHSLSVIELRNIGIDVFYPSVDLNIGVVNFGSLRVQSFDLTTLDGRCTHTNADGTECHCCGFLITHKEMGRMLYITDTKLIKWRFKGINHILLGVNYDKDLIDNEDSAKVNHVYRGHMSIDTACDFVKANNSKDLQNVIMCHLSKNNADKDLFIDKMKSAVPNANVDASEPKKEWLLRNPNECPF